MSTTGARPILRLAITTLLALCVAALGFAPHHARHGAPSHADAPSLAALAGIDLSLYTLPDGTIPDLCLTVHGAEDGAEDGGGHADHETPRCPACTLTKTIAASAPATAARFVSYAKASFGPPLAAAAIPQARPRAHRARGPPLVVFG